MGVAAVSCGEGRLRPGDLALAAVSGGMRSDGRSVYYIEENASGSPESPFVRVAVGDGTLTTLWTLETHQPLDTLSIFSIDSDNAYFWVNGFVAVPLGGGGARLLGAASCSAISSVAQDQNTLYAINPCDDSIVATPKVGGASVILVPPPSFFFASELAVDAQNVYWATVGGEIMSVPAGGGATGIWAAGQSSPTDVVVDGTALYWVNTRTPTSPSAQVSDIMTMPLSGQGSTPPIVLAANLPHATGLTIDNGTLYWMSYGQVVRLRSGAVEVVVSPPAGEYLRYFTFDSVNIYWATVNAHGGTIHVAAKSMN